MSKDLTSFPVFPYQGSINSRPVGNISGAAMVPVFVEWFAVYGAGSLNPRIGVGVNLTAGQAVSSSLDKIRAVKIDNTFCPVPVYVQFVDTLDTVVCPANDLVILPVFTNDQKVIIYAEGFVDGQAGATSVELLNINVAGIHIPSNELSDLRSSLTDIKSFSAADPWNSALVKLGPATPDRMMVCSVAAVGVGVPSLVTIILGGVVLKPAIVALNASAGGLYSGIFYYENFPLYAAIASITVDWAGAMSGLVSTRAIYNWTNALPFAIDVNTNPALNRALLMSGVAGGVGCYVDGILGNVASADTVWSGADEDAQSFPIAGNLNTLSLASGMRSETGAFQVRAATAVADTITKSATVGAFWS